MNNNLTLDSLITKLKNDIDEIDLSALAADTEFRKINGWNSLYSLIIMALVSTEYDVELNADEIQAIKTVEDLFLAIQRHGS